jgi:hypothetical protein
MVGEHDLAGAAEDHGAALGRERLDARLGAVAHVIAQVVGIARGGEVQADVEVRQAREERPVGFLVELLLRDAFLTARLGGVPRRDQPVGERQAHPTRQERRDHAATRAVRRRHGDEPGGEDVRRGIRHRSQSTTTPIGRDPSCWHGRSAFRGVCPS